MTDIRRYIKELITKEKLIAIILSGSAVATAATGTLKIALTASLILTVMLTVSSAASSSLGKFTGMTGMRIIFVAVAAFVAATSVSLLSIAEYDRIDELAVAMLIATAAAVLINGCPERDDGVLRAVVKSAVTSVIFSILLITLSFLRELIGIGSILGQCVMPHDLPIALTPAGALIALGIMAALINFVFDSVEKRKTANAEKEKEADTDD